MPCAATLSCARPSLTRLQHGRERQKAGEEMLFGPLRTYAGHTPPSPLAPVDHHLALGTQAGRLHIRHGEACASGVPAMRGTVEWHAVQGTFDAGQHCCVTRR